MPGSSIGSFLRVKGGWADAKRSHFLFFFLFTCICVLTKGLSGFRSAESRSLHQLRKGRLPSWQSSTTCSDAGIGVESSDYLPHACARIYCVERC